MTRLKFTPEMFTNSFNMLNTDQAAKCANDVFCKWLSEQPLVYGWGNKIGWFEHGQGYDLTARLVDVCEIAREPVPLRIDEIEVLGLKGDQIEELKNYYERETGNRAELINRPSKPCEHEPNMLYTWNGWTCKHCGANLKANWIEK